MAKQLLDEITPFHLLSLEERTDIVREIRRQKYEVQPLLNIKLPKKKKASKKKASKKKTQNQLSKLLSKLSPEQKAKLLKELS